MRLTLSYEAKMNNALWFWEVYDLEAAIDDMISRMQPLAANRSRVLLEQVRAGKRDVYC